MDFGELLRQVGLWPAAVIVLAMAYDKIRREQVADLKARVAALEDDARNALKAKDAELAEYRRLLQERPRR